MITIFGLNEAFSQLYKLVIQALNYASLAWQRMLRGVIDLVFLSLLGQQEVATGALGNTISVLLGLGMMNIIMGLIVTEREGSANSSKIERWMSIAIPLSLIFSLICITSALALAAVSGSWSITATYILAMSPGFFILGIGSVYRESLCSLGEYKLVAKIYWLGGGGYILVTSCLLSLFNLGIYQLLILPFSGALIGVCTVIFLHVKLQKLLKNSFNLLNIGRSISGFFLQLHTLKIGAALTYINFSEFGYVTLLVWILTVTDPALTPVFYSVALYTEVVSAFPIGLSRVVSQVINWDTSFRESVLILRRSAVAILIYCILVSVVSHTYIYDYLLRSNINATISIYISVLIVIYIHIDSLQLVLRGYFSGKNNSSTLRSSIIYSYVPAYLAVLGAIYSSPIFFPETFWWYLWLLPQPLILGYLMVKLLCDA